MVLIRTVITILALALVARAQGIASDTEDLEEISTKQKREAICNGSYLEWKSTVNLLSLKNFVPLKDYVNALRECRQGDLRQEHDYCRNLIIGVEKNGTSVNKHTRFPENEVFIDFEHPELHEMYIKLLDSLETNDKMSFDQSLLFFLDLTNLFVKQQFPEHERRNMYDSGGYQASTETPDKKYIITPNFKDGIYDRTRFESDFGLQWYDHN
ncbi:uncharacterized protein LOC105702805 isoform X1 [Orussus abietinus]|uniref:uncharacterized protein LOC105702805 isoform X1 n=1 Tax=Orussus abietinus TaxID=222816 RepID=UPI00062522D8|nr:uncharacterized protein LOC105702805 isoform X1 [Orussus abietinus]